MNLKVQNNTINSNSFESIHPIAINVKLILKGELRGAPKNNPLHAFALIYDVFKKSSSPVQPYRQSSSPIPIFDIFQF